MVAVSGVAVSAAPVLAKETAKKHNKSKSKRRLRVAVFGDSLGDGMYAGLTQVTAGMKGIRVQRYSRANTGIVRSDRYNWNKAAKKLSTKPMDVAVLVFGANDIQGIRTGGKRYYFGHKRWKQHYTDRVTRIIQNFRKRRVKVYVVGLPIVRQPKVRKGYAYINKIFRQVAKKNGATYIETWSTFADSQGRYTPSYRIKGRARNIRQKDGIHFTMDGYRIYARRALKVLRKNHRL